MNVQLVYKSGKTPDIEREFQNQLRKLERRLQVFKPDLVSFHATVDQRNGQGPSTSLNLRLPSGQMAAQSSGDTLLAAIKNAFADLSAQLKRHKELLREKWERRSRRRPDLSNRVPLESPAESPLPAGAAEQVTNGSLEAWLSAGLPQLAEFVDRELQARIADGEIPDGEISRDEVIDEVMVAALSNGNGTAVLLSQESWFRRLAVQAIRRLARLNADTADVSLEGPAGTQNVTGSDENVLQYHQPDDSLREESTIRDRSVFTPEEIFASEEMVAQLDLALQEVGSHAREAFVLYTLEGFTVPEIARLTGRSPDQVRESIEHARTRLQEKLPAENDFRGRLLRRSRVA